MIKFLFTLFIFISAQTILRSQVTQEWVQRYGNQANGFYNVARVAVDNSGNVFVSGSITGSTLTDYITIKYNSSGILQWAKTFSGGLEDRIIDMALDRLGNICVTGLSENQTGTYDIITIKYNTGGDSLWVKRYNGANPFTMDQPVALFVDNNNNIYVSGYSFGSGGPMNYVTIKYNSLGDSIWVARYPAGGTNLPRDIFVDSNGNVYVYGRGTLIIKYNSNGNLLWNKSFQLDAAESNKSLVGDSIGNIYFIAKKFTSTFEDYVTVKINSNGDTLWTRIYNGLGTLTTNHDEPNAISIDMNGNVFITGESSFMSSFYFSTIKYNSNGVFQWERVYTNPQNGGGGNDIVNDKFGNVYITGGSNDYVTIKYNTNGDSLWAMNYNGPSNLNDFASAVTIDNLGNVYVSGISREAGSSSNYDMATIKYSQSITNITYHNGTSEEIKLYQNYPNPFNPITVICYSLIENSFVTLKVYDVLGNELITLVDKKQNSGSYEVKWDATNYPSGIYFSKLEVNNFSEVKNMMLLK